ncbi:MAG: hypothetical protein R2822_13825 [Spirosomataceae bacterium]
MVWNDFVAKEDLKQPDNSWKSTLEVASEKSQKWHQAVSSWIVNQEKSLPKKHLISHNIANFKMPAFATDPNISIYTFHYALPEAATINYALNKAIGFNETGFAGKSDDTYRRQAWRFMMSGGGLFGHLDYSFSVGQEEGTDLANNAPGGGSPTLRSQFKILKNTLESTDLATLQPNSSFLGPVEGAFVYPMKDKRSYLVYMEPILPKSVVMAVKLPKGKYTLAWKDVLTGKTLKFEKLEVISYHYPAKPRRY